MNIDEILERGALAARLISPDINPLVMSFAKWAELQEIMGTDCAEAVSRVAMCLVSQATQDMTQQPEATAHCGHDGCSRKIVIDMACMAALMASSFMAAQMYYAMEHGKDADGDELYPQRARASINSAIRLLIDRENWTSGLEAVAQAEAPMSEPRTFTCAVCGETFECARDEAEAAAEHHARFPDIPLDQCGIVCDDCFKEMQEAFPELIP